jgi:RNA polymerase sigma-70 factor (ECF subfamily)
MLRCDHHEKIDVSSRLLPDEKMHGRIVPMKAGPAHPGDRGFIDALARGDKDATLWAFEEYAPLVRRLIRRVLGPYREIEDVVQDVFLRLFQRAGRIQKPEALTAFVIALATRVAQTELRRAYVRRIVGLGVDDREVDQQVESPDFESREILDRFYGLLDRLRPADRTAFVLRYMEELELLELARAMNVSLRTAKRRVAHARERVARLIEGDPGLREFVGALKGDGRGEGP